MFRKLLPQLLKSHNNVFLLTTLRHSKFAYFGQMHSQLLAQIAIFMLKTSLTVDQTSLTGELLNR